MPEGKQTGPPKVEDRGKSPNFDFGETRIRKISLRLKTAQKLGSNNFEGIIIPLEFPIAIIFVSINLDFKQSYNIIITFNPNYPIGIPKG